jgi:hypothetical protein
MADECALAALARTVDQDDSGVLQRLRDRMFSVPG